MSDRQLVSKYHGSIVPVARDENELQVWRLRLEESLFERLNQMTADPNFLLEIEQKTEACFNELMGEGAEKLRQHAEDLSAAADKELTLFKKKAGDHLEERIQLATKTAHTEAELHATRLRNDTENIMNKQLLQLTAEAKTEARDYALAGVKSSLDNAERQIETKSDSTLRAMIKRFDNDAADRIRKLLKDASSTARTTLQTFADDHIVEIRRRVEEDIERVFSEVRKREERSALALIKSHAIEETRLISTTIETKIDTILSEARSRQKSALALLDERADTHSTAAQQIIQRHVKTAWLTSERDIKTTIEEDMKASLQKHQREIIEYVDKRMRENSQASHEQDKVEKTLKAYVETENQAQDERQKLVVKNELSRVLEDLDDRIRRGVATAAKQPTSALADTRRELEQALDAVKEDVREAVRDLDEKIALVSRTVTNSDTGKTKSFDDGNKAGPSREEIDEALASIDTKIKAEVARTLSGSAGQSSSNIDDLVHHEVVTAMTSLEEELRTQLARTAALRTAQRDEIKGLRAKVVTLENARDELVNRLNEIDRQLKDGAVTGVCDQQTSPAAPEVEAKAGVKSEHNEHLRVSTGVGVTMDCPQQQVRAARTQGICCEHPRACSHECSRCHQTTSHSVSSTGPCVSSGGTQTISKFEEEAASIEDELQRAWDAAGDEEENRVTPTQLRSLEQEKVSLFLDQLSAYQSSGGKQHWSAFVRPGLMVYLRTCELDEPASDADIFAYLQQKAGTGQPELAQFVALFENVHMNTAEGTRVEQVVDVMVAMEDVAVKAKASGQMVDVPIEVYKTILLSKLPAVFSEKDVELKKAKTKKEIKAVLVAQANNQEG